jgi:glucan-binding YG repeat protein
VYTVQVYTRGPQRFYRVQGLAAVKFDNDKWGYVDKTGKVVINPQFDLASSFEEGLAAVNTGYAMGNANYPRLNGKWGYLDKTGKYAINPQFEEGMPFQDGLAAVKVGGKWGYVNKTGRYIWNPQR